MEWTTGEPRPPLSHRRAPRRRAPRRRAPRRRRARRIQRRRQRTLPWPLRRLVISTKTEFELREEEDGSLVFCSKTGGVAAAPLRVDPDHVNVHSVMGYNIRSRCYFDRRGRLVQSVDRTKGAKTTHSDVYLTLGADGAMEKENFEPEGSYKMVLRKRE